MKNISEVQKYIFEKTGLKTSVSISKGSMKGYLVVRPMFQNGEYPDIPWETTQELHNLLKEYDKNPQFLACSLSGIYVFGMKDDRINYKKESKGNTNNSNPKGWGSKNSQLRLDKATKRYAKRLSKGNCARYY